MTYQVNEVLKVNVHLKSFVALVFLVNFKDLFLCFFLVWILFLYDSWRAQELLLGNRSGVYQGPWGVYRQEQETGFSPAHAVLALCSFTFENE